MSDRTATRAVLQRGATLIEVLIALLLLAAGLLGTAMLQTRAQQVELDSYQRTQALILAQDMVDRININRRAAGCYQTMTANPNFVGTGNNPAACSGWGTSSTRARADADMQEWTALLTGQTEQLGNSGVGAMTGARGCVDFNTTDEIYTVTVAWQGDAEIEVEKTDYADNDCAADQYGGIDFRRVVSLAFRLGDLD